MIFAGTPTARALSGTVSMTTAFAPISTLLPMVMFPNIFAPVPILTLLPIWSSLFFDIFQADGYTIPQGTIITKACISADDDITKMVDTEICSNRDFAGKFNTGYDLDEFVEYPVKQGKGLPYYVVFNGIAPSSESVDNHHPKSLAAP